MVQEADAHKAEDEKFKELADARNQGDQVAYQLEKTLKELGDKVGESERQGITQRIEALRETTKGEDPEAIRAAIEAANQEFSAVSQRMYEAAGAADAAQAQADGTTGGPVGGGSANAGDDVIEGEFEAEDK